jgi:hypothetical protein
MIQAFDETFIILDALDECKGRQELLENIDEIGKWKTEKLHILCTSRREKDISYGGHDQIVQRLLEAGADVNAQGRECVAVLSTLRVLQLAWRRVISPL